MFIFYLYTWHKEEASFKYVILYNIINIINY